MKREFATGAPRLLSPVRATAMFLAVTIAAPQAQVIQGSAPRNSETPAATTSAAVETETGTAVTILVGRSAVLNVGAGITRVSLTSPTVADAMVTSHNQLLIHGKAPGTISMFVWDRAGGIRRYEVTVERDLTELARQMKTLFPGESITVAENGRDVVISGTVSSKYVIEKAESVAAGYVEKKEHVVNLLKQQDGTATEQVLLRVRFAEVSRSAMTELGVSLFSDGRNGRFARTTTQQFPAPFFDQQDPMLGQSLVFSDYLNLFLFDAKNQLGGVVRALQNRGLFQSLAEPNLVAENGKEASFLAGGEYPYPVIQGQAGGTTVTIQFKEYGIKLNFTPTIVGSDLIKLKVRPEVSSLDFGNALVLEGFRIPALQTRRTETEIELQDGQTFAIAGLMNNTVASQLRKVPGIGDIPVLGLLFRSKAAEKGQTELVVMITPQILRRGSHGVSPALPNVIEPYLGAPDKSMPSPGPWEPVQQPRTAVERERSAEEQRAEEAAREAQRAEEKAAAEQLRIEQREAEQSRVEARRREEQARAEAKRAEEQARLDGKRAEEQGRVDAKQAAEQARTEAKRTEAQRKADEKEAREQAKIAARLAAEQAKVDAKRAEEQRKAEAKLAAEQRRADEQRGIEQARRDRAQVERDRREADKAAKEQERLEKELLRRQTEAGQATPNR